MEDEPRQMTGIADTARLHPDGVEMTIFVAGQPEQMFIPLVIAEVFILHLRRACDDLMKQRQQQGMAPSRFVAAEGGDLRPAQRAEVQLLLTGDCILSFDYRDGPPISVCVRRQDISGLGSALSAAAAAAENPGRPN